MLWADIGRGGDVGDGSANFEDAVVCTERDTRFIDSHFLNLPPSESWMLSALCIILLQDSMNFFVTDDSLFLLKMTPNR